MTSTTKTILCLGLLCGALAATTASAPAAFGATSPTVPCWKTVFNEWASGYIKGIFPIHCYQQAIHNLPPSETPYTSAKDDIAAAEAAARLGKPAPPEEDSPQQRTPTTTTTASGSSGGGSSFPLPLIILGALAVALVIAGGVGMVWQRRNRGDEPPAA